MKRTLIALVATAAMVPVVPAAQAAESSNQVSIVRDEYGVPHVFADDIAGLFHGMGYVAADDRLWQGEILRRSATGTLAELFGPDVVGQDIEARTLLGPVERRQEEFDSAPSEVRMIFESYVAGMNALVEAETAAGTLPEQFAIVGPPRPWTTDDALAVVMLLGSQFGWFGSDELDNLSLWNVLQERFGAEAATVFGDLFWLDDPDAPTTSPDGASHPRRADGSRLAYGADVEAAAQAAEEAEHSASQARERAGLVLDAPASNAIVMSGRLSATGKPLLLGGPQMGYSTPQINHEVGLHGAGYDVTGMTIAGFPLIPIGVTPAYAWTLTSGGTDNTDIFVEALDPADPSRYLFDGDYRPMDCRTEQITVAGADPVTHPVCATVHGPVIGTSGDTALSLQNVTVGLEMESFAAWNALGSAGNIGEFASGLDEVAYNFNVLYADRTGNIAYWHIGHVPIRAPGVNPFFPTPGTGEAEWQGTLPFADNPQAVNPARGWMTSWNNKPEPGWANTTTGFWLWGPAHRVNTLIDQLERIRPRTATVRTIERINRIGGHTTDTPTGTASNVFVSTDLDTMLSMVDTSTDSRLAEVVGSMRRWNRLQTDEDLDGGYDTPWGEVFNAWWFALVESVFGDVADVVDRGVAGNLVDRLLRGDAAALPLRHDWLGDEAVDVALTRSLIAALDGLTALHGSSDPNDWAQPVATIDWDPLPLTPGVGSTIWMNRGTYNQIVSLTGRVRAQNVISPGQSGEASSPHFADQLGLYSTWTYKPMHLTRHDVERAAQSSITLDVP